MGHTNVSAFWQWTGLHRKVKNRPFNSFSILIDLVLFVLIWKPVVCRLLEDDIRNNSAWNQRFFVISSPRNEQLKSSGGGDSVLSGKLLEDEIDFTLRAISGVPGNESAWNYLRGYAAWMNKRLSLSERTIGREDCLWVQKISIILQVDGAQWRFTCRPFKAQSDNLLWGAFEEQGGRESDIPLPYGNAGRPL